MSTASGRRERIARRVASASVRSVSSAGWRRFAPDWRLMRHLVSKDNPYLRDFSAFEAFAPLGYHVDADGLHRLIFTKEPLTYYEPDYYAMVFRAVQGRLGNFVWAREKVLGKITPGQLRKSGWVKFEQANISGLELEDDELAMLAGEAPVSSSFGEGAVDRERKTVIIRFPGGKEPSFRVAVYRIVRRPDGKLGWRFDRFITDRLSGSALKTRGFSDSPVADAAGGSPPSNIEWAWIGRGGDIGRRPSVLPQGR